MDVNLTRYIEYCRGINIADEAIMQTLLKAGWKEDTVTQALNSKDKKPKKKIVINLTMWTGPMLLAFFILVETIIYSSLYFDRINTRAITEAIGGAAALMIGVSFALSSMSYYFDFLDNKLAYRKEIGLTGYYFALTYAILLVITRPQTYFFGFFGNLISWDFILGLLAMAILTAMAIVSINKVMMKVTPLVARKILRLGYFAYFLLILRAIIVEHETWLEWFATYNGLPPARLLISFFASFVIILRIMMALSLYLKKDRKAEPVA